MTNSTARDLNIALDFFGAGQYQLHLFRDAEESAEYADRLEEETRTVNSGVKLHLKLAPAGGCAGWLARTSQ